VGNSVTKSAERETTRRLKPAWIFPLPPWDC